MGLNIHSVSRHHNHTPFGHDMSSW